MSEEEAHLAGGPHAPPAPPGRRRVLVLVAIAVGALLTGLVAWGATRYSNAQGKLDDVEAVRRVAGDFGAATLTYDHRDLRPFERRMKAHATGTFRRQLQDGLDGLKSLITELRSQSVATVKQIYVSDLDDGSAAAIVVVEARAKNGDDPERTLEAAYIELQLLKVGKRWRIDGVSTLDLGGASSGPSVPGATTTTAPPAN